MVDRKRSINENLGIFITSDYYTSFNIVQFFDLTLHSASGLRYFRDQIEYVFMGRTGLGVDLVFSHFTPSG